MNGAGAPINVVKKRRLTRPGRALATTDLMTTLHGSRK